MTKTKKKPLTRKQRQEMQQTVRQTLEEAKIDSAIEMTRG